MASNLNQIAQDFFHSREQLVTIQLKYEELKQGEGTTDILDEVHRTLVKCKGKADRCFKHLYETFYNTSLSASKAVLRDEDDAADNVSHIFTKIWSNMGFTFDPGKPFGAYVYLISLNRAKFQYKKIKKRIVIPETTYIGSDEKENNIMDVLAMNAPEAIYGDGFNLKPYTQFGETFGEEASIYTTPKLLEEALRRLDIGESMIYSIMGVIKSPINLYDLDTKLVQFFDATNRAGIKDEILKLKEAKMGDPRKFREKVANDSNTMTQKMSVNGTGGHNLSNVEYDIQMVHNTMSVQYGEAVRIISDFDRGPANRKKTEDNVPEVTEGLTYKALVENIPYSQIIIEHGLATEGCVKTRIHRAKKTLSVQLAAVINFDRYRDGELITGPVTYTDKGGHTHIANLVNSKLHTEIQIEKRIDNKQKLTAIEKTTVAHLIKYANGNIRSERNYNMGVPHGRYILNYENGSPMTTGSYRNGVKQGPWVRYYDSGVVKEKVEFEDGIAGYYEAFTEEGTIEDSGLFFMKYGSAK